MTAKSFIKAAGRVFLFMVFTIVFTVAGLEFLLRFVDPTGVYARQVDLRIFYNNIIEHPSGFQLQPGVMDSYLYDATILDNGNRLVPDTNPDAECMIAAVGDSMTFGYSVDDEDTWVNLLAQQTRDVKWVNTGRPNYNIEDVIRLIDYYPADGYVYLHFFNDDEVNRSWNTWETQWEYDDPYKSAIYYYWRDLTLNRSDRPTDPAMHEAAIAEIDAMPNVMLVAYDNDLLLEKLPEDTTVIGWHNHPISPADLHPDDTGNQVMADEMLPYIQDFISEVCE